MIYMHLNKQEIDGIVEILNLHSVRHEVQVNEDMIEAQNEAAKRTVDRHAQHRRSTAFYNLRIEGEEFAKIPEASRRKLERFNIYPEITDVVFEDEKEEPVLPVPQPKAKGIPILGILALLALCFLALKWVDRYVVRIFPK